MIIKKIVLYLALGAVLRFLFILNPALGVMGILVILCWYLYRWLQPKDERRDHDLS